MTEEVSLKIGSYDSSDLHVVRAIRIDFQKRRISDEIISSVIKLSHITSKHERGLCYRPQRHLSNKPKELKRRSKCGFRGFLNLVIPVSFVLPL